MASRIVFSVNVGGSSGKLCGLSVSRIPSASGFCCSKMFTVEKGLSCRGVMAVQLVAVSLLLHLFLFSIISYQ